MPRGTELTDLEKGHIIAFNSCGISNREIGRRLSRSESVIRSFLKNQEFYGTNKHNRGRKRKLTSRDIRRILQTANNSTASLKDIKETSTADVSRTTIHRVLNSSPHLKRSKMKFVPRLLQRHKLQRQKFARQNMSRDWTKVNN